jgi:hypothetical protein
MILMYVQNQPIRILAKEKELFVMMEAIIHIELTMATPEDIDKLREAGFEIENQRKQFPELCNNDSLTCHLAILRDKITLEEIAGLLLDHRGNRDGMTIRISKSPFHYPKSKKP